MGLKKNFEIEPNGIISGGFAHYAVSEDGIVYYKAEVQVKVVWFLPTKTYPFSGSYKADPLLFKSTSFDEVGELRTIGNVEFKVMDISETKDRAAVSVRVLDQAMSGVATANIKGEWMELVSLSATVAISGMVLHIKCTEAE